MNPGWTEPQQRRGGPIVGRQEELRRLRSLLAAHRVVTLVAGAGFGKTRTALELVSDGSGVFCSLAACRTPEDVCAEVVGQMGLPAPSGNGDQLYEQVGRAVAQRGHPIVVLDNVEQIADGLDRLLAVWQAVGSTAFLVTSRRKVGVVGEEVVALEALPIPADPTPWPHGGDAVDLFYARARGVALDRDAFDDVLAIVRSLEGIPLAIELAAARLEVLTLEGVRARLGQRMQLLRDPTGVGRHATLWNALDWSWQLLAPDAQRALLWLSVFSGGFDADAATGVLGPGSEAALAALVDGSLVRAEERPLGRRYFLFEVVREFAELRLGEAGERDEALARHAEWYVRCALQWGSGIGQDRRDVEYLDHLLSEERNLDAALRWVLGGPADVDRALLALAVMRGLGWAARALYSSERHLRWLGDVLAYAEPFRDDSRVRLPYARIRFERGVLHLRHLHQSEAGTDLEFALAEARRWGDALLACDAMGHLASWESNRGDPQRTEGLWTATLDLANASGNAQRIGWSLGRYGVWLAGRLDGRAEDTLRQGLDRLRAAGAEYYEARVLTWLGYAFMASCRLDEAQPLLERGLTLTRRMHARDYEVEPLLSMAAVHHMRGNLDDARSAYLDTLRVSRETGVRQLEAITLLYLALLEGELERPHEAGRYVDLAMPLFETATDGGIVSPLALISICAALADRPGAARSAGTAFLALPENGLEAHRAVVRVVISLADGDATAVQRARDLADAHRLVPSSPTRIEVRALDALVARADRRSRTWRVHPAGTWFASPGGAAVDLSRRPVLAAMCAALARARVDGPDIVSQDDLVAATWPGERIEPSAARNRLHTTLHALRGLGLPIDSAPGRGWLLEPAALVAWDEGGD